MADGYFLHYTFTNAVIWLFYNFNTFFFGNSRVFSVCFCYSVELKEMTVKVVDIFKHPLFKFHKDMMPLSALLGRDGFTMSTRDAFVIIYKLCRSIEFLKNLRLTHGNVIVDSVYVSLNDRVGRHIIMYKRCMYLFSR